MRLPGICSMKENMNTRSEIAHRERTTLSFHAVNMVLFALTAFTGLLLQIVYHFHHAPAGFVAAGLDRGGWLFMHKISASLSFAGLAWHSALHWRAVRAWGRKFFKRKAFVSLPSSWYALVVFVPLSFTALVSWALCDAGGRARFALVEVHDKFGLLFIVLATAHVSSRFRRMAVMYQKLVKNRGLERGSGGVDGCENNQ